MPNQDSYGDFEERFKELSGKLWPKEARKGLAAAGSALLRDAVIELNTVPKDEGTLRGSGSVFVGKTHVRNSPNPKGTGTPATELNIPVQDSDREGVEVVVGFNQPQAAWLHENPDLNFSEPGSGAKYLESKMQARRENYLGLVANAIGKAGR